MSNSFINTEIEKVLRLLNPQEKEYLSYEDAKLIPETAYMGISRSWVNED